VTDPGRRGGFTLIEVLISTALLSFLMLLAGVVTRGSMTTTGQGIALDSADGRVQRALERARRQLASASLATLQAEPLDDPTLQPMTDAVAYDNVAFRQVTGFAGGEPLLEPDLAAAPMRLWFEPAGAGGGTVWLDDGAGAVALVRAVDALRITKAGRRLDLAIDFARPAAVASSTMRLAVALVVP